MQETLTNPLAGWTLRENGDIACQPLVAFGSFPFGGGMGAILRWEWATDPSFQHHNSVQVAITLPMLEEMIQRLNLLAKYMRAGIEAEQAKGQYHG